MSLDLFEPQVAHREVKGLDHLAFKELSHSNIVGLTQYGLRMRNCHIDSHFSQQQCYTFSGKKINALSGEKDLLKRLCRKERLIWNQGLEGHLKRGRVTAFKSYAHSSSSWVSGPLSQRG